VPEFVGNARAQRVSDRNDSGNMRLIRDDTPVVIDED